MSDSEWSKARDDASLTQLLFLSNQLDTIFNKNPFLFYATKDPDSPYSLFYDGDPKKVTPQESVTLHNLYNKLDEEKHKIFNDVQTILNGPNGLMSVIQANPWLFLRSYEQDIDFGDLATGKSPESLKDVLRSALSIILKLEIVLPRKWKDIEPTRSTSPIKQKEELYDLMKKILDILWECEQGKIDIDVAVKATFSLIKEMESLLVYFTETMNDAKREVDRLVTPNEYAFFETRKGNKKLFYQIVTGRELIALARIVIKEFKKKQAALNPVPSITTRQAKEREEEANESKQDIDQAWQTAQPSFQRTQLDPLLTPGSSVSSPTSGVSSFGGSPGQQFNPPLNPILLPLTANDARRNGPPIEEIFLIDLHVKIAQFADPAYRISLEKLRDILQEQKDRVNRIHTLEETAPQYVNDAFAALTPMLSELFEGVDTVNNEEFSIQKAASGILLLASSAKLDEDLLRKSIENMLLFFDRIKWIVDLYIQEALGQETKKDIISNGFDDCANVLPDEEEKLLGKRNPADSECIGRGKVTPLVVCRDHRSNFIGAIKNWLNKPFIRQIEIGACPYHLNEIRKANCFKERDVILSSEHTCTYATLQFHFNNL